MTRGACRGGVLMIFMYIVHCAVVYDEYEMTVYISWKIVGLLWNGGRGDESHTLLPIELSQSRGFEPRHGHIVFVRLISATTCIKCPKTSAKI